MGTRALFGIPRRRPEHGLLVRCIHGRGGFAATAPLLALAATDALGDGRKLPLPLPFLGTRQVPWIAHAADRGAQASLSVTALVNR